MRRYILFITILFVCLTHVQAQLVMTEVYKSYGPYSNDFEVRDTENSANHTSPYGRAYPDIVYSLDITISMDLTVSHCGSSYRYTRITLLDSREREIEYNYEGYCSDGYHYYSEYKNLPSGRYYIISEPDHRIGGDITTTIKGTAIRPAGNTRENPIYLWTQTSNFYYSDTKNIKDYTDNYWGNGKDIFYKFTITKPMDIVVSNWGSSIQDTFLDLLILSPDGKYLMWITENDDSYDTDACPNPQHAFIQMYSLEAGTYYVVSSGKSSTTGNITTRITGTVSGPERKGSSMSSAIDLGTKSSEFKYKETIDTNIYPDVFDYACDDNEDMKDGTGGVYFKVTLSRPMNITVSHDGSHLWDTYIHLLNASGTCLAHDNSGYLIGVDYSKLTTDPLPAGTYYIYSEGCNNGSGYITTTVEGKLFAAEPSKDQNYIFTITPTIATLTSYGLTPAESLQTVQYFDGLGRLVQTNNIQASPNGSDLITYQEYDQYGRPSNSWLPAIAPSNMNGACISLADFKNAAIASYSGDTRPYTLPVYEASPLSRILEEYGPGQHWDTYSKRVKTSYLTNITGDETLDCYYYSVTETPADTLLVLTRERKYNSGELFVTRIEDEEGNTSFEFKNKLDQVVLIRRVNPTETDTPNYDTYYVYDDYGCLMAVLPPEASDIFGLDSNSSWNSKTDLTLKNYAYLYKYDSRNQCKAKKLPGCSWMFYVYDKSGQTVFSQDGEQRIKNEWHFSIVDGLGRVCLTGLCNNSFNPLNNIPIQNVIRAIQDYSFGEHKGYSVSGIELVNPELLMVNYYDDYEFLDWQYEFMDADYTYKVESGYDTHSSNKVKGLLTGTLIAILDVPPPFNYFGSVNYYDYRKRVIQTSRGNHVYDSVDKEYIAYNHIGEPIRRKHIHIYDGQQRLIENYAYDYDHAGRLNNMTHQLTEISDSGVKTDHPSTVLVKNAYDGVGRLLSTSKANASTLTTNYMYNIRSWTEQIQNPLFIENLSYGFNGNILSQQWNQEGKNRRYDFTYDHLSRLESASYSGDGAYATSYSYNKNGNITQITRNGNTGTSSYGVIDNLTMTYNGNQLIKVIETGVTPTLSSSLDFRKGEGAPVEYFYNTNGSLMKDLNKGITNNIRYNHLNLPHWVSINNDRGRSNNYYLYAADGLKLNVDKTNYNTDYLSNVIYENGKFKRLLFEGGYFEDRNYYFYIQDHLGNNRIVANKNGNIIQSNQYYPFGMPFADEINPDKQPYKYGGKELDSDTRLNLYDYSARYMDAALGRFTTMDPMAEKYYSWSPYVYVMNNPMKFIDPDGCSTHTDSLGNVIAVYNNGDMGVYKHNINGSLYDGSELSVDDGINMGVTLEWDSFIFAEEGVPLGRIDFDSFEAADMVFQGYQRNNKVSKKSHLVRLMDYGLSANNGETYDLKSKGGNVGDIPYYYRGSQIAKGVFISMRDAGNILAGMIAKRNNLSAQQTYSLFGALQLSGNKRSSMLGNYYKAKQMGEKGFYGELPISHKFQKRGYEMKLNK